MTSSHFPHLLPFETHTHTHIWLYLFSVARRKGRRVAGGPPKSDGAVSQRTQNTHKSCFVAVKCWYSTRRVSTLSPTYWPTSQASYKHKGKILIRSKIILHLLRTPCNTPIKAAYEGAVGNCPDTHAPLQLTDAVNHFCLSFSPSACVSLQCSSVFVMTRSNMGGACSFTHTHTQTLLLSRERVWAEAARSRPRQCVYVWSDLDAFNFLQPDIKRKDKTRRRFPCPSIWLFGSQPSKGFLWFLFSSRPHASTLRSPWSGSVYCGQ